MQITKFTTTQNNNASGTHKYYSLNHKKRHILFLLSVWLILTDFYSFSIILTAKKFYMRL